MDISKFKNDRERSLTLINLMGFKRGEIINEILKGLNNDEVLLAVNDKAEVTQFSKNDQPAVDSMFDNVVIENLKNPQYTYVIRERSTIMGDQWRFKKSLDVKRIKNAK